MKVLNAICSTLSGIIIAALAAIAIALILPKLLGMGEYVVLSGSMEPTIHVGAIVYDKAMDASTLREGDVVTYRLSADALVTHRVTVIDREEKTVITKGDANDTPDANPIPFDNIVGVVKFNIPYLGFIAKYMKTGLGIGVICGILVILIILNALPDLFKEDDEEKETNNKEKN